MKMMMRTILAAAAMTMMTQPGWAHVKVVASTPAEGAVAKRVNSVTMTFSDALVPAKTGTELVMTAMPGMANHGLMYIRNYVPSWSDGNRKLTLTLKKPLQAGSYVVKWKATGMADGHVMSGEIKFDVK